MKKGLRRAYGAVRICQSHSQSSLVLAILDLLFRPLRVVQRRYGGLAGWLASGASAKTVFSEGATLVEILKIISSDGIRTDKPYILEVWWKDAVERSIP